MNKLFFILMFLSSFFQTDYCKLSDKIFNAYNKTFLKEKNMHLIGQGGAMMYDIEKINAHYYSYEPTTLEQARKLYVDIIEGYLQAYNSNEKIRPYLHNYPFNVDNLDITISFKDELNQRRGNGYIALMFRVRGKIFYETYDHDNKNFVTLLSESYEEARQLLGYE